MQDINLKIFYDLAIILFSTKLLGTVMKKLGLPQVVGALLAGLLIGPAIWGIFSGDFVKDNILVGKSDALDIMASIGVVLIMFSAGLETNVKEMKKNGKASFVITIMGVIVPLALGFLLACAFNGGFKAWDMETVLGNLFWGVLLTATSVGITVECLKELGKLKGRVGSSILAAAVLDDIIGVIILSVIIGVHPGKAAEGGGAAGSEIGMTVLKIFLFFVAAVLIGIALHWLFKKMAKKYPHHRRMPIFSLAICFFFAWAAEFVFGVAEITGAYVAGIILSNMSTTEYVDKKIDTSSYMLFSPIFFANIGIKASFEGFNLYILGFAAAFVVVGILSKLIGCGLGAKMCGYSRRDSLRVGIGMVARGEVCLIMADKGIESGLIEPQYLPAIIVLVIVTSLVTPLLLKLTYRGKFALEPLVEMSDGQATLSAGAVLKDFSAKDNPEADTAEAEAPSEQPPENQK